MSIPQLETGVFVIEVPARPVARVVTGFAVGTETAQVYVLFFMARPAIRFGVLESGSEMTFVARNQSMQPGQRKAGHTMIKFRFFP
jgi:hypothetical protein